MYDAKGTSPKSRAKGECVSEPHLTIGSLAALTKTSVPTIRFYEEIALLPRARRAPNGHRYYRDADLKRLGLIKRCRDFGFSIKETRELIELWDQSERSCIDVRKLAQTRLAIVRTELEKLRQLETTLAAFVEGCDEECCKGTVRDCRIIEDLSNAARPAQTVSSAPGCCRRASES
jgi:DNA-binding transcriptional MerR regulator